MATRARGGMTVKVRKQRGGGPSMAVPGKGKVVNPKGTQPHEERSARKFTTPMTHRFGQGEAEHAYEGHED